MIYLESEQEALTSEGPKHPRRPCCSVSRLGRDVLLVAVSLVEDDRLRLAYSYTDRHSCRCKRYMESAFVVTIVSLKSKGLSDAQICLFANTS